MKVRSVCEQFVEIMVYWVETCRKPKFDSDSVFKKTNHPKIYICSDDFPTETACNPPFK